MEFTRVLKRYMTGEDVRAVKDRLVDLGYLYQATHNRYGDDTYKAVKAFQAANNLEVDGICGPLTISALFADPQPVPAVDVPKWIAEPARTEISRALAGVSAKRREICLLALQYCVDRNSAPKQLKGFYIRGANLFDKDLSLHVMTQKRLESYFSRSAYEPYYDGGRKEMMLRQAKASGYTIPGSDCSGMIVGLWRKAKVVSAGFDANANNLYGSYCVQRKAADIQPGDLAHKNGHIGLVVCGPSTCSSGGGLIVESAGGAYGIQIAPRTNRRLLNFVDGKVHKLSGWQHFGDPKVY